MTTFLTEPHNATHRPCPIACLIGPSGAGKSTLAAWTAEDLGLVHLEIDRYPHGNGVVLSLPSRVVPHDEHLDALARESITLVVLYGSGADCMDAFLRREQARDSRLGTAQWIRYNAEPYASLSTPRFAPFRLSVFEDGAFRSRATLVVAIEKCLSR